MQCHSVATKCDSCHTRHRFERRRGAPPRGLHHLPLAARRTRTTRPTSPPPTAGSTWRKGDSWDWSKPLAKGNYKAPTCAYCHMDGGQAPGGRQVHVEVRPAGGQPAHLRQPGAARALGGRCAATATSAEWSRTAAGRAGRRAQARLGQALRRRADPEGPARRRPAASRPPASARPIPMDTARRGSGRARASASSRARPPPSTTSRRSSAIISRCGTSTTSAPTRPPPTAMPRAVARGHAALDGRPFGHHAQAAELRAVGEAEQANGRSPRRPGRPVARRALHGAQP